MNQQGKLHSVLQRVSRRRTRQPLQQHNSSTRERRNQRDTQLQAVTSLSSLQTDRSRLFYSRQLSLSLSDSLEGDHFKEQNGVRCQTQYDVAVGNISKGFEVNRPHKQLPFSEYCMPSHNEPITSWPQSATTHYIYTILVIIPDPFNTHCVVLSSWTYLILLFNNIDTTSTCTVPVCLILHALMSLIRWVGL